MAIGLAGGEGAVGGAVAGIPAAGATFGASILIGAAIGAVLGAGFSALGYYLAQQTVRQPAPNRDAVQTRSDRTRPVPLAFGRCRTGGTWIEVGAWWWRDSYLNRGVPNIRLMNAMLALCEGPLPLYNLSIGGVPGVGNFRMDGRPLEMIGGLKNNHTIGAPCHALQFTTYNGSNTQTISPPVLDNTGSPGAYPAGNRYGYTSAINSGGTIDPTTPGVTTGDALAYRNTAFVGISAYSGTVYEPPRLNQISTDLMGPDYTIRRQNVASDGPNPSDVAGYAFWDSGYVGDPNTDAFYATLTSSGVTAAPFGLVRYGRMGSSRVHQPPPTAMGGSAVRGWYMGKHDVLCFQDISDPSQFWVGYWGISAGSSDWQKQKPHDDYSHPIIAWCLDEAHSSLHTLHNDGTVRFLQRWNLLTGQVDRLDTDLPNGTYRAMLYSADISRYVVARDSAAVHLIDPTDGTTVNLITGLNTSACVGVLVTGQQVGVVSPSSLYYADIYTGQLTGPLGGSSTGTVVGALGGIVSAQQNTFTGKITVVGPFSGNPLFRQFAASCVEDPRDIVANGTSGLSGLPNSNPAPSRYNEPEPSFQAGQIIGSQAFPFSYSWGRANPVCVSAEPGWSSIEHAAGVMSAVTDAFRDWSWRTWALSPATAWQLKLLEGNSSLAAAGWAATVNEQNLDSQRYGGGFDASFFSLASFEALHSWCVGVMTFQNPPDAQSSSNPDVTTGTRLAERYKFDYILESRMSVSAFLGHQVLMACGGYSYTIGHVMHLGIPKPGILPVLHLSDANHAEGSFSSIYSANVDGVNRIEASYRDVLDEYRTNVVQVQDENSVNSLGRVQMAAISIEGCGRDQSAQLLAKSILDNSNAGRRQAGWKTDFLAYALAPTDGIEVSNKQLGFNRLRMRLSSVKETGSNSGDALELAAIEYRQTLDALDNNVNLTSQPGNGVGSGFGTCPLAYAPYLDNTELQPIDSYFNDGAAFPPGVYSVSYVEGAITHAHNGIHYFAGKFKLCTRDSSTGHVILLGHLYGGTVGNYQVTWPDPATDPPDGLPGWSTYGELQAANLDPTVNPLTFTLASPGTIFIQPAEGTTAYVAAGAQNLTFQLCAQTESDAPDPTSIPGMTLWLKADALVYTDAGTTLAVNGQSVQQWNDSSGNAGNVSQATLANRPTYLTGIVNGYPVVAFNAGGPQSLANATNYTAPFTAFVVARMIGGTSKRIFSAVSNNWLLGFWNGGRQQAYYNGTVKLDGVPAVDLAWRCYGGSYDTTTGIVYENGVSIASVAGSFAGPNGVALGTSMFGGPVESSDCQIAEVLIYNTALSPTDRATVEAYLSAKYNLGF